MKILNKKLLNIFEKAGRHKTLIENFSYLSALQIFNLILPLLTYPYLIRVLGKETYGLIVFAQATIAYLQILVGFGFNMSATKEISIHRDNPDKLSEIVSSVYIIKSLLFILSFLILLALILLIPEAKDYKLLFILTMWLCLYDVLYPIWYFQGIEKMKYITFITLTSRLIFVLMIFILIHSPSDYLFIPAINGIGALIAGFISIYIVIRVHHIKFKIQSINILTIYIKDSFHIFISTISAKIYVQANKVIIGTLLGMTEVAYYDLGEKITTLLKVPQSLLSQALFPKVSKEKNSLFVKKIFKFSILFNLGLFLLTLVISRYVVLILGGKDMLESVWVINILALSVPIIAMSNIFAIQLLIPFGYPKKFTRVLVAGGVIYLLQVVGLALFSLINVYTLSIIHVTTEIFVTSYSLYFCKKYKLW